MSSTPRRGRRGPRGEIVALAAVVALLLLPLVLCARFPTQDGPAHLENAGILTRYHEPGSEHLRRYYTISSRPDPTWLAHLALAGLLAVAPARVADKLFVAGYTVAFVAALWWALRGVNRRAASLTFLGLPLVFNYLLHLGFYSFGYSVAAALLVLGLALRRERWTAASTLGLTGLVLLVWALHPVSAMVAVICTLSLGVADAARAAASGEGWPRALRRHLGPPTLACLPLAALVPLFGAHFQGGTAVRLPVGALAQGLVTGEALVAYDAVELWATTGFVLGLGALLALEVGRRRRPRRGSAFLLATGVVIALYFTVPDRLLSDRLATAAFVSPRLLLYAYLLAIFVVAARPSGRRVRRGLQVAGAAAAITLMLVRVPSYVALDVQLEEYVSAAPHLERGTTVLPLSFAPRGLRADGSDLTRDVQPFLHAAGWVAVERDLVEFGNYEAAMGYFPVRWRREVDPYTHLGPPGGHEETPPRVEIAAYEARTRGSIDAVLLWGPARDRTQIAVRQAIVRELAAGWDLAYTSPRGLMEVYRRRPR
jgi:hypothetical protein